MMVDAPQALFFSDLSLSNIADEGQSRSIRIDDGYLFSLRFEVILVRFRPIIEL